MRILLLERAIIIAQDNISDIGDAFQVGRHGGFLEQFAMGGGQRLLTRFDMSAGQAPHAGQRRLGALAQEDQPVAEDGDADPGAGARFGGFFFNCRHRGS